MNYIPDVLLSSIQVYLSEEDTLQYSIMNKLSCNVISRKKVFQYNAARRVRKIFAPSPYNPMMDEFDTIDDINNYFFSNTTKEFVISETIDFIKEFANYLMKHNNYPVLLPPYKSPSTTIGYRVKTFASSQVLQEEPIIYNNVKINIVYRCKWNGRIRNGIRRSLTLRALVG